MMVRSLILSIFLFLTSLWLMPQCEATVSLEVSPEYLLGRSDLVIVGTVIEKNAIERDYLAAFGTYRSGDWVFEYVPSRRVFTDYTINVKEAFRAPINEAILQVTTFGGRLPDGAYLQANFEVDLRIGNEIAVFLEWDDKNEWFYPIAGSRGVYRFERDSDSGETFAIPVSGVVGIRRDEVRPDGRKYGEVLTKERFLEILKKREILKTDF